LWRQQVVAVVAVVVVAVIAVLIRIVPLQLGVCFPLQMTTLCFFLVSGAQGNWCPTLDWWRAAARYA